VRAAIDLMVGAIRNHSLKGPITMNAQLLRPIFVIILLALSPCQAPGATATSAAADIDKGVDAALARLYRSTTPQARALAERAKGILVFPGVVKAGFIGGVQYGRNWMD
jgi:lipid-binding SYLF domain-containing protein